MVFACLYTIRAGGYHLELEARGNLMHCERNHPGVTNCKVVCIRTDGFGCWFSAGVPSPCVCGSGEEQDWKGGSVFIEMIGRHYWHVGGYKC